MRNNALSEQGGGGKVLELRRKLSGVPKDFITNYAQAKGYVFSSKSKMEVVQEALDALANDQLAELINEFQHGGRGSIYVYRASVQELSPLLDTTELVNRLSSHTSGPNPFQGMCQPALDKTPRLVYAELSGSQLYLLTAHQGACQERLVGWQYEEIVPTVFVKAFIDLNTGVVQVRGSRQACAAVLTQVSRMLAITKPEPLYFSEEDLNAFSAAVGARSRVARHRRDSGGIEYVEYAASDDEEDLDHSQEYLQEASEYPVRRKRFNMEFRQFDQNIVVSFEMTVNQNFIHFRTPVGEGVISRVLSAIRGVKGIASACEAASS